MVCTKPPPTLAADAKDLFGTVLGEIGRQIDRKQKQKQLKRLEPLWQACADGDVVACDAAAKFPLTAKGRRDLARMRDIAVRRPQFERDWNNCQRVDATACTAALRYPGLNREGRTQLRTWRREAISQRRRQAATEWEINRLRTGCLVENKIGACTMALKHERFTKTDRNAIVAHGRKLLLLQRQQEAAAKAQVAFQALRRQCFQGRITSCSEAIAHPNAIGHLLNELTNKHAQLLALKRQQERRLADQRQYNEMN